VQWFALALGIVTGAIYGYRIATTTGLQLPSVFGMFANVCYVVCRVSIMTFYVATIVRLVHNAAWRPRLTPIATVGRMPLTNYLLQTLIATSIFYSWGLGLWGRVGPALQLALAIAIYFAIQVPLSQWWLNRFALGPMEYVWRWLTYGPAALKARAAARETAPQH